MRLFIAIELPLAVRDRIAHRAEEIRRQLPPARWVPPQNLHLTLCFLGDVEAGDLAELGDRLGAVATAFAPMCLQVGGAGTFPPRRPARVAWVRVEADGDLGELQRQVAAGAYEVLERRSERREFHAHVTVARPRRPWPRRAAQGFVDAFDEDFGHWEALRVVLVRSRLEPDGARYDVLQEYPFDT